VFWWQAACAVPGPHIFQPWQSVQLCLLGVPPKRVREVKLLTDIDEVHDLGLPDYAVKNLVDAYLVTGRRTQGHSARDARKGWEKRHGALPGRSTGAIKNLTFGHNSWGGVSPSQPAILGGRAPCSSR